MPERSKVTQKILDQALGHYSVEEIKAALERRYERDFWEAVDHVKLDKKPCWSQRSWMGVELRLVFKKERIDALLATGVQGGDLQNRMADVLGKIVDAVLNQGIDKRDPWSEQRYIEYKESRDPYAANFLISTSYPISFEARKDERYYEQLDAHKRDLVALTAFVEDFNERIRAAQSGHSYSDPWPRIGKACRVR